ncbi:hypothetical protein [Streptomyces sp. NPDC091416]|uniref:hypothetical protein n=1 Tax=Streptomyces sp. NPDC091416 TaxID=3366003 RepID=UPI003829B966
MGNPSRPGSIVTREIGHTPFTVSGEQYAVLELVWNGDVGRSYDLVRLGDDSVLTEAESFDSYPTDGQIAVTLADHGIEAEIMDCKFCGEDALLATAHRHTGTPAAGSVTSAAGTNGCVPRSEAPAGQTLHRLPHPNRQRHPPHQGEIFMNATRSGVRIAADSTTTNTFVPGPWTLRKAVLQDDLGGEPHFVRYAAADGRGLYVICRAGADGDASLPVNELATAFVRRTTGQMPARPLRGPVVVLGAGRVDGLWRTGDLPDFHRALLYSLAREHGWSGSVEVTL